MPVLRHGAAAADPHVATSAAVTSGIDTYLVCPDHGDVFVHRDAGPGHPVAQAHEVVPLRGDVAQPRTGDAMRCPLCGADLHVEHRQRAGA